MKKQQSFDPVAYWKPFREARKSLQLSQAQATSAQQSSERICIKHDIKKLVGSITGTIKADKVLNGTCVFGSLRPVAREIIFREDGIFVLDSDGNEHDFFDVQMNAFSLVNVLSYMSDVEGYTKVHGNEPDIR